MGIEKQCIGNEWVKRVKMGMRIIYSFLTLEKISKLSLNHTFPDYAEQETLKKIPLKGVSHYSFRNFTLPPVIKKWSEFYCHVCNFDSFTIFKIKLLKFIPPYANIVFNSHNPKEIK